MLFELNEYKKELTDEEILEDIKSVASSLGTDYIPISTYKKYGKYSQTGIKGHFGTWKKALASAGLRTERTHDERCRVSNEVLFEDLRRVAKDIQKNTITWNEYRTHGKFSCDGILKRFGKWNTALQKAGLNRTGFIRDRITEQQCFDEIERIWIKLGRQPTSTDIIKNGISIYSIDVFKRRFGGWRKALEAFVNYINSPNENRNAEGENEKEEASNNSNETKTKNEAHANEVSVEETRYVSIEPNKHKPTHQTSRNINTRLRFLVLKRDNFKCCACGASPAKDPAIELHVDHIIPWSKGGETTLDNLQTLCSKCNLGKSDLL